jgi:glycosyltransferase involved in cell wall biosynthesis
VTARQPLSVLYFTNVSVRAGAEEHLLGLARGIDRREFQPLIVCPPALARLLAPDLPADTELVEMDLSRPAQLGTAARLARLARQRKIDILHSHMFRSSLFASPLGRLAGVPVVVETPHVNEQWRHGWLTSHYFVDRLVGRTVDAFIAVSRANARYLVEQKGFPESKIRTIPNGIDLKRFHPGHQAPTGMRAALGFAESDPVIAVFARLEPQKGHRILLEAMARVREGCRQARLLIVGDGTLRPMLERQCAALGLTAATRFVGRQANIPDWLALAQVVALPSFFEGLPLAAMEALAAEKPLVATAVDGTPEVVLDGQTGLTVPPGDAPRLAEALLRLLRHRAFARALGRAGREWIQARYTHAGQVRATEQLYRELWEKRVSRVRHRQPDEAPIGNDWRVELP